MLARNEQANHAREALNLGLDRGVNLTVGPAPKLGRVKVTSVYRTHLGTMYFGRAESLLAVR